MVARGPGAVGCAHCRMVGAIADCVICKRLVCETCLDDWTTCDQPSGRVVRLGMAARLRDVDPIGRLGVVGRWRRGLRLIDLRRLQWVDRPDLPGNPIVGLPKVKLAANARYLYPQYTLDTNQGTRFARLASLSLLDGTESAIELPPPAHGEAVSTTGDRYWHACTDESIVVVGLTRLPDVAGAVRLGGDEFQYARSYVPLPGKVVQSVFVDSERDLLAAGTWGTITLGEIVAHVGFTAVGQLRPLDELETDGDVRWIAVCGSTLAAAITGPGRTRLAAWRLRDDLRIGDRIFERLYDRPILHASLSRDGRYLAAGLADERVVVHAIDDGTTQVFTDHTDDICLVRFAADDHLLITADDDNRVVLRPRGATGYVVPAIEVDLVDDAIPITDVYKPL